MSVILSSNGTPIEVDEADFDWLNQRQWSTFTTHDLTYARDDKPSPAVYIHRLIVGAVKGEYVDHINRNGLDNRRENLRIVSQGVNIANAKMASNNTSGFKGVTRFRNGWMVQIKFHQRHLSSNVIKDIREAALLRDELARRLFGDIVYLNLPDEKPSPEIVQEAMRLIRNRLKADYIGDEA